MSPELPLCLWSELAEGCGVLRSHVSLPSGPVYRVYRKDGRSPGPGAPRSPRPTGVAGPFTRVRGAVGRLRSKGVSPNLGTGPLPRRAGRTPTTVVHHSDDPSRPGGKSEGKAKDTGTQNGYDVGLGRHRFPVAPLSREGLERDPVGGVSLLRPKTA